MADLIEHCGVVERTERDTVYVRITSRSACGTCKARQACGLAEAQDKIVAVATPEAGQYAAGREVMVGVRRSAGVRAVVLAYVGALAVLLAVVAGTIAGAPPRIARWGGKGRAPSPLLRAWAFIISRCGSFGGKSNTQFNLQ